MAVAQPGRATDPLPGICGQVVGEMFTDHDRRAGIVIPARIPGSDLTVCHTHPVTTSFRAADPVNEHGHRNGHAPFVSPLDVGARLVIEGRHKHGPSIAAGLARVWRALTSSLLIVLGFAALTYAAFLAHPIAGWAVAGVSLIVLDKCRQASRPEVDGDG